MYCICQHYLTFEWFTLGRIRNPGWILLFLFLWWTDISDSSYCQCGRFYWLQLYWNLTLSVQTCTTVAELRETWARVEFTRKLCAHNSGPMLIILGVFISLFCSVLMWSCSSAPPSSLASTCLLKIFPTHRILIRRFCKQGNTGSKSREYQVINALNCDSNDEASSMQYSIDVWNSWTLSSDVMKRDFTGFNCFTGKAAPHVSCAFGECAGYMDALGLG